MQVRSSPQPEDQLALILHCSMMSVQAEVEERGKELITKREAAHLKLKAQVRSHSGRLTGEFLIKISVPSTANLARAGVQGRGRSIEYPG